jgi:hypothetical protein
MGAEKGRDASWERAAVAFTLAGIAVIVILLICGIGVSYRNICSNNLNLHHSDVAFSLRKQPYPSTSGQCPSDAFNAASH